MGGLLQRARQVTAQEWVDLARALIDLVRAECVVRLRSRGSLLAFENSADRPAVSSTGDQRARQLAWAVRRAAEYGPVRSRCLAKSVALHRLLRAEGIAGSRIHIGVRPDPSEFLAHAWVTLGNRVLGDDPAFVARFIEIADARTVEFA